jgi:imidazoleglycerol-phosphate dehydratase
MSMEITIDRKTKETDISVTLDLDSGAEPQINTTLPFFDHILYSMAFHGGFFLKIDATGDTEVDPHHLVEDTGLTLGQALLASLEKRKGIQRYGHAITPMDEALSEVTIDVGGRPYFVYRGTLPQNWAGQFDLTLIREFWIALAHAGKMNVHGNMRYGENGHHMIEALFKSLGRALSAAYKPKAGGQAAMSTKGTL